MRIDPADVFAAAVGNTPIRIFLALLALSAGPLIRDYSFVVVTDLIWMIPLSPLTLWATACDSAWYTLPALALMLYLFVRTVAFLFYEQSACNLIWMGSLSILVCAHRIGEDWIPGLVIALCVAAAAMWGARKLEWDRA